jgi:hypothetical protein
MADAEEIRPTAAAPIDGVSSHANAAERERRGVVAALSNASRATETGIEASNDVRLVMDLRYYCLTDLHHVPTFNWLYILRFLIIVRPSILPSTLLSWEDDDNWVRCSCSYRLGVIYHESSMGSILRFSLHLFHIWFLPR